ncbi:MAG: hypothetical protein KHZ72_04535 [Lachnospiraceae bacterium]|nr:hypothetical protein [Lachnospiraceae bacterium]
MSQEKVNRYKEEKANRKKMLQRQKFMNTVRKTVVSVVGVAVLGWVGYSAYNTYTESQPRESYEVDYSAVTEYLQGA